MMTDPIADMLVRVKNALQRRHAYVDIPHSGVKLQIAKILRAEGFVQSVDLVPQQPRSMIRIKLKYETGEQPVIRGVKRVSRPGRRVYVGYLAIRPVEGGIGVAIVSTPLGLLTDRQSRDRHVGGEILCQVW
jgi:small subunit ribosomal protein S8